MKKIISIIVSTIIATQSMIAGAVAQHSFVGDYEEFAPYRNDKEYKASTWMRDVLRKYDIEFYQNPKEPATRGEVFLLLLRATQETLEERGYRPISSYTGNSTTEFKDLSSIVEIAQEEAMILKHLGILQGDETGKMNFKNYITRAEFSAILTRFNETFFRFHGTREAKNFIDVPTNSWYKNFVSYSYQIELMNGITYNMFNPLGNVTIEEVIKVLDNIVILSEKHDNDYILSGSAVSHSMNYTLDVTSEYNETTTEPDNNKDWDKDTRFIVNQKRVANGGIVICDQGEKIEIFAKEYNNKLDDYVYVGNKKIKGTWKDDVLYLHFKLEVATDVTFYYENGKKYTIKICTF